MASDSAAHVSPGADTRIPWPLPVSSSAASATAVVHGTRSITEGAATVVYGSTVAAVPTATVGASSDAAVDGEDAADEAAVGDVAAGEHGAAVFYNRVQVLNRDLSVTVLRVAAAHRAHAMQHAKAYALSRASAASASAKEGRSEASSGRPEALGSVRRSLAAALAREAAHSTAVAVTRCPPGGVFGHASRAGQAPAATAGHSDDRDTSAHTHTHTHITARADGKAQAPPDTSRAALASAPLPGLTVCEALSATGLRAIRMAAEAQLCVDALAPCAEPHTPLRDGAEPHTPLRDGAQPHTPQRDGAAAATSGDTCADRIRRALIGPGTFSPAVARVYANDMDAAAVDSIRNNVRVNAAVCGDRVVATHADAVSLLSSHTQVHHRFDWVDVDPYGSASVFMDAAVRAVADGGVLAITCTDMSVLAGADTHAARGKYGGIPVKSPFFGEQALRLVLAFAETTANRYRRTIQPLLSMCVDFYIRIFVKVVDSPGAASESGLRIGHAAVCTRCHSFWPWAQGVRQQPKSRAPRQEPRKRARPAAAQELGTGMPLTHQAHGSDGEEEPESSDGLPPSEAAGGPEHGEAVPAAVTQPASNPRRLPAYVSDGAASRQRGHVLPNGLPAVGHVCAHCGGRLLMAGPLWLDPIHDTSFATQVLDVMVHDWGRDGHGVKCETMSSPAWFYDLSRSIERPATDGGSNDVRTVSLSRTRLMGILRSITEELPDVPLYYDVAALQKAMHATSVPSSHIVAALRAAGFRTSETHAAAHCLKTDAPVGFLWDVLRACASSEFGTVSARALRDQSSVASAIMTAPPAFPERAVDFSGARDVEAERQQRRAATGPRYVMNPGENWGPGSRASGAIAAAAAKKRAAGSDVRVED